MSVTDSTSTDHQYIVESTYTAVLVYVLAQYTLNLLHSHTMHSPTLFIECTRT